MSTMLKNRHVLFVLIWIIVSGLFQFHKIVVLPPVSVHQGAQTDRACIALNYYQVSMNFFLPRVMETAVTDGITPCEFPLINYSAAICYKLFGFSSFWYRFLMWSFMGIGLWAAFDLLYRWLKNVISALLITFTWYSSTVLAYYSANFLPDVGALCFILLALRQWYLHTMNPGGNRVVWFAVLGSLACLIKITCFVFIIGVGSIALIRLIKGDKTLKLIFACFIVALFTAGWYSYCQWLEKQVGYSYFLMTMVVPGSIAEFREYFHIFYANWFTQIYTIWQWIFIGFGIIGAAFIKEKSELKPLLYLTSIGLIGFYVLMARQFRYHDYYIITLLPIMIIAMGYGYKLLHKISPWLGYGIVLAIFITSFAEAKNNVRSRFTPSHYWYQTFFEPAQFKGIDPWLTQQGVTQKQRVAVAFDPTPNTILYFINRRGLRISEDDSTFNVDVKLTKTDVLLTNDSLLFFNKYPSTRKQLTLKTNYNTWLLFEIKK